MKRYFIIIVCVAIISAWQKTVWASAFLTWIQTHKLEYTIASKTTASDGVTQSLLGCILFSLKVFIQLF